MLFKNCLKTVEIDHNLATVPYQKCYLNASMQYKDLRENKDISIDSQFLL